MRDYDVLIYVSHGVILAKRADADTVAYVIIIYLLRPFHCIVVHLTMKGIRGYL